MVVWLRDEVATLGPWLPCIIRVASFCDKTVEFQKIMIEMPVELRRLHEFFSVERQHSQTRNNKYDLVC